MAAAPFGQAHPDQPAASSSSSANIAALATSNRRHNLDDQSGAAAAAAAAADPAVDIAKRTGRAISAYDDPALLQRPSAAFRFPSVHLGSFDSLSQTSSSPSPTQSLSGTPASIGLPTPEEGSLVIEPFAKDANEKAHESSVLPHQQQQQTNIAPSGSQEANTLLSPTPSEPQLDKTRIQASPGFAATSGNARAPPPTLGSLPVLSPISPLDNSLSRFQLNSNAFKDDGEEAESDATTPFSNLSALDTDGLAWPPPPISSAGGRSAIASFNSLSSRNSRHSVLSPEPLTPTSKTSFDDLASPRLRDSPGVPRRRTIIESSSAASRLPPIEAAPICLSPPSFGGPEIALNSSVEEEVPPSPSPTPKRLLSRTESESSATPLASRKQQAQSSSESRGPGLAFPEPHFASAASSSVAAVGDRQRSTDTVSQDASPSKKRSLPRPPSSANGGGATPTPNRQSQTSETAAFPMPMPIPMHSTRTVLTRPTLQVSTSPKAHMAALGIVPGDPVLSKRVSRSSLSKERTLMDKSYSLDNNPPQSGMVESKSSFSQPPAMPAAPTPMPMPYTRNHQSTKSASNFPAIAGLADAGPYPTAQPQGGQQRAPLAGARNGNALQPPQGFKPTEEVCLECMMRDRDLADVDVTGADAWERSSAGAFEELKSREYDLLRTMSLDHSTAAMSLEDASIESESVSSPLSHTSTLPEDRIASQRRQQQREARRTRTEERDQMISKVGWRGFKWEEGSGGEGFPRGFRGTKPGALTEKGIKNVMTMVSVELVTD